MCGRRALDLTGNRDFPAEWLRAMTGAIAHRGPDDEYFHREPGLALGTRRLAIVDLAGGRQPLANEDKTVWVSFNGELFDYPELRQQLLVRGHHLATRCDTELWVHLYEDHGERVFERHRASLAWHYGTGAAGCCCWAGIGWGFFPCTTPRPTAGCFGPRRSRPCWPPEWSSRGPSRGESIICFASSPPAKATVPGHPRDSPGAYLRVKDGRMSRGDTGTSTFPTPGRSGGWSIRPRWWTNWSTCFAGQSSDGCGAMCRSCATSAAGWIRRSCWGSVRSSGASRCRLSPSAWTVPVPTNSRRDRVGPSTRGR